MHIVFFFFSSRRRHTRCSRDWSSDVCSSDLIATELLGQELQRHRLSELEILGAVDLAHATLSDALDDAIAAGEDPARDEALGRARARARQAPGVTFPGGRLRHGLEVHPAPGAGQTHEGNLAPAARAASHPGLFRRHALRPYCRSFLYRADSLILSRAASSARVRLG